MVRKLKPEIKQLWLAALRSGDYKQAQGVLRNPSNAMCCLGVLCNLHAQAHPKIAAAQDDPTVYMGDSSLPPEDVMKWAFDVKDHDCINYHVEFREDGIDDRGRTTHNGATTLVELNDSREYSFKQIANVIDKYL